MMRYLYQVPSDLNFLHSRDDRFAAQIVYATGPRPPMYRLVDRYRPFHFCLRLYLKIGISP